MDIEPQNQITETSEQSKNSSKITTLGAWMIVIGLALGGFSIDEYFKNNTVVPVDNQPARQQSTDSLNDSVFPSNGYETNAKWGNIGPLLIKVGAISPDKFKELYSQGGGLNAEELAILETGSESNIKITKENSHFVLNMLWAFGLAQKNKLLTEGDMIKYGDYKKFASTGGWTIATSPIEEFYSKFNWLNLSEYQEERIKNIASNVYRPCCNNHTAFPDCNHGMAALGLIEIMIASGDTDENIYEALKYFNSFWFASSYLETAIYFKEIKGVDWDKVDAKEILSKEYSSASGWAKNIHKELENRPDLLPQAEEGGGCGV